MNSLPNQEKIFFCTAAPYNDRSSERWMFGVEYYQDSNLFDSTIHGFNSAMLTRLFSVF
jgi:hypothetical protein